MRLWRIDPPRADVPVQFVTDVIAGIGTENLAGHLLMAMQRLLAVSHCTVFALQANGCVQTISAASDYGVVASITASQYLQERFDLLDSNMIWMSRKKTPAGAQTWMRHQFAEDVPDLHYRALCYDQPGIRERTSILLLGSDGLRIAVSFYRNLSYVPFEGSDFDMMMRCAPIVHEAVTAHIRKASRTLVAETPHQKLLSSLAGRERQVLVHVLAGKTTREVAELLDLAPTTVLTYRYRAFTKLGIRTFRDLTALLDRLAAWN